MTSNLIITKLFPIYLIFLVSFNSQNKNNSKANISNADELNKIVLDWNNAHNSKHIEVFTALYDDSVLYYGIEKDKNTCIESKLSLFKKYPNYNQQVSGNIQQEKVNDSDIQCSFIKRVIINQRTKDYPSYLIFSKKQSNWKIINEGDSVTDKNLAKAKEIDYSADSVEGDFNGDGIIDYAWLVLPKDSKCQNCDGTCTSYVIFSDKNIPSIKVENCIDWKPTNLGDLNKNGTDELGFLPIGCAGCWRGYDVYTLENGKWIFAVEPFATHCDQWEDGIIPIELDPNKKGNVMIRYSVFTDSDIVVRSKSVPIK